MEGTKESFSNEAMRVVKIHKENMLKVIQSLPEERKRGKSGLCNVKTRVAV